MKQVKSDEARRTFGDLLSEVEYHGERFEILRYKRPSAMLVPKEWYERAEAALEQTQREEQGR